MKRAIAALLLLVWAIAPALAEEHKETTYERVVRTKTLRCAYTTYPTFVEKDPNTGQFSGMFYDLVNELGRQLGLKIEWTEEVGSDAIFAGLDSGRYDAVCAGYWASPSRAWAGDFTKPIVFTPYNLYVRADENRFADRKALNDPAVTIVTLDGEFSQIVAKEDFPKAKEISVPGLTDAVQRLEMVATRKADFTPMEAAIAKEYMARNPGKIKQFGDKPVLIGGSIIGIPHNEYPLKAMLDTGIDAMLWGGAAERIIAKYEKYPGSMLLPALAYQPE